MGKVTPKWTPGPWSVQEHADIGIDGGESGINISIPEIGRSLHDVDWADAEDWTRDLANAHLIAAAPELYEALELFVREAEHYYRKTLCGSPAFIEKGNAALAKARGEQ